MIGRLGRTAAILAVAGASIMGASVVGSSVASAAEWVPCARENGYCRVPYPTVVRYGARGSYAEAQVDRGVGCNNDFFSDPARGTPKACFYLARDAGWDRPRRDDWDRPRRDEWDRPRPPRDDYRPPRDEWGGGGWVPCARENEWCDFRGRATVRYGARGAYATTRAVNGISCDNDTFGGDPISGVPKRCEVRR